MALLCAAAESGGLLPKLGMRTCAGEVCSPWWFLFDGKPDLPFLQNSLKSLQDRISTGCVLADSAKLLLTPLWEFTSEWCCNKH